MPDFVFWALLELIVVRLIASQNPRWWLAAGLCAGVAMNAKWNIAFLVRRAGRGLRPHRPAPAAGQPLPGHRSRARGRAGRARHRLAGRASLAEPGRVPRAADPGLAQPRHLLAWPGALHRNRDDPGLDRRPGLDVAQSGRPAVPAGRGGCAIAIALQFVLGGKPYYPGGAYVFLLAAGCVAAERWLARRRTLAGRVSPARLAAAAMLIGCAVALPVGIPVLPATVLRTVPMQKINYDLAESIGWPAESTLIARVYQGLPAGLRQHATILAGNYGEAGALQRYGAGDGLPAGLQRRQLLLAVGTASGRGHRRRSDQCQPGATAPRVRPCAGWPPSGTGSASATTSRARPSTSPPGSAGHGTAPGPPSATTPDSP